MCSPMPDVSEEQWAEVSRLARDDHLAAACRALLEQDKNVSVPMQVLVHLIGFAFVRPVDDEARAVRDEVIGKAEQCVMDQFDATSDPTANVAPDTNQTRPLLPEP